MRSGHCALIVEDQERVAKDLAEILASIDCDAVIANNKEDAISLLKRDQPCLVLLDLSIPRTAREMKGRPAVGLSLLQEIRSGLGKSRAEKMWIPIIVVSGHAREVDQAVEIMKLDADDLIQKPYDEDTVIRKVREALRKSGRESHSTCAEERDTVTGPNVISIPGRMVKNRTVVTIGGRDAQLSDRSLIAFLELVLGHIKGESIALCRFDRDEQNAYKVIDRLRTALRGAVTNPTEFVINASGGYSLPADIVLGAVDSAWLAARGIARVAELADEIDRHRE